MSLGARATKGGAKAGKDMKPDKGKTEKPQPKEKVKPQATTEQLRMAHMIDRKNEDASDVRRMVLELMEMTCRTEEEVCSALHDSDNDMVAACNLLLEESQRIQGEWQTNEKKKKKPPAATGNGEAEPPQDPRSRSQPRPRRGEGEGAPRGRGGPRGRGARGAARGRGGRRGAGITRARPRDQRVWGNEPDAGGNLGDSFPATEDWENEEWSGSLSDTKVYVFTPSASAQNASGDDPAAGNATEDWDAVETNGPSESHIPSYTYHNAAHTVCAVSPSVQGHHLKRVEMSTPHAGSPHAGSTPAPPPASPPPDTYHNLNVNVNVPHQPMGMSGSLTAAQSQYLSQLTQQSQRHDNSVYASNYGVYGAELSAQRKQRARVPPPSKIPSMAVEMPGGSESGAGMFLDVQFGALEPDTLQDTPLPKQQQVTSQAETQPVSTSHEAPSETPNSTYPNSNSMLSESLSSVEPTPTSQPAVCESIVTNSTAALEKQLTASMKQLSVTSEAPVSTAAAAAAASHAPPHNYTHHHRPKQQQQQSVGGSTGASGAGAGAGAGNVYAHHAVSHHPPVYGANVYATQVNSTNASLTAAAASASAMAAAYPPSVTLTQYQPMINSYQQTSSSATVYGGSALYTAAPYTAYQPTPPAKIQPKDNTQQYDSSVASSNSLTNTSTTQASAAKVSTTAVTAAGVGGVSGTGSAPGAGYAAGALYGAGGASATYAAYDEAQMMRSTLPHHMGGYYEVGYGVSGGREGTFGLGAGERFGRTDAASPQQVPAAALPPGYAYFYQPPPTTYQYGVYPTYGGGSSVGGVGGVGGVSGAGAGAGKLNTYAPQQPPYDAQDTYKPAGPYTGAGTKAAGGAAELTNAMYPKTHVALNKVNSYEKASFHSGTPPPFGAGSHLYIAAAAPPPPHHHAHHHQQHHQQHQHQMDVRVNSSHNRRESAGGGRSAASKPPASKPTYSQSYWAPN